MKDLVVLPDYKAYVECSRDNDFGFGDKKEYTQHWWRFQKVEVITVYYIIYVLSFILN